MVLLRMERVPPHKGDKETDSFARRVLWEEPRHEPRSARVPACLRGLEEGEGWVALRAHAMVNRDPWHGTFEIRHQHLETVVGVTPSRPSKFEPIREWLGVWPFHWPPRDFVLDRNVATTPWSTPPDKRSGSITREARSTQFAVRLEFPRIPETQTSPIAQPLLRVAVLFLESWRQVADKLNAKTRRTTELR